MCDDDHRHAGFRQAADNPKHLPDQFGIECRCRLVEQDDARRHRERPRNRNTLLLTARKAVRQMIESGSHATLCWREMDSNFRFRVRKLGIRLELN